MNKRTLIISLISFFLIVSISYAADKVFNIYGNYIEAPNNQIGQEISDNQDQEFGAFPGTDIFERINFHTGLVSVPTFNTKLSWATSSKDGTTQIVLAQTRNDTGDDLFCDPQSVLLDVSTAVAAFGGSYRVGTTTLTGNESLTNTTTATLLGLTAITTSTASTIQINTATIPGSYFDGNGNNTSTPFVFSNGHYLVATMNNEGGATSSDSFQASGGFTGVGRLKVNCWNRFD